MLSPAQVWGFAIGQLKKISCLLVVLARKTPRGNSTFIARPHDRIARPHGMALSLWISFSAETVIAVASRMNCAVRDFVAVEGPRCSGKVEHRLVEVLVIAVSAVIANAESGDGVALYGRGKLAWLRTFLEMANGLPSHHTFRRVFILTDLDAFEAGFTRWVGALADRVEWEAVAIEGKTIRRSFDHGREQSPLHVVSAWPSEQGLRMGQRCVDGKSNEITAVPVLLDRLALKNSIEDPRTRGRLPADAQG